MVTITIRDVPDDIRNALAARAERCGRSLNDYFLTDLVQGAVLPTMDEALDEIEADLAHSKTRLSVAEILAARDEARRG